MNRVILKLSGEALFKEDKSGYDDELINDVARQIKTLVEQGMDIGIVIGGGNYWRGVTNDSIRRIKSDQIGMLATVMNCIYVSEKCRKAGLKTEILTPFKYANMTTMYTTDLANELFAKGTVVFFAGGTGHPFFSTDTAISLRAAELDVDAILLAKNIDGVYDSDPAKNENAVKFDKLTVQEMVDKHLQVIDMTASVMCMENEIELYVFALKEKDSIIKAFSSEFSGTHVTVK